MFKPEIKLEKEPPFTESGNNYSENTTLRATALFPPGHSQAGQVVQTFNEKIKFEETGTNYCNGNDGATSLPQEVQATAGVAEIVIKSLSNSSQKGMKPQDATAKATADKCDQHGATNPMAIPQWVDEDGDGNVDWAFQRV